MPTIHQLTEIWDELPDEPKGPVQRKGPQYKQFGDRPFRPNPMAELRNGDRAFIVAVNDSGNTGWLRFGRTGFGEQVMI
jgi:tRNA-splicing endonuclease subunit Sen54